MGVNVQNVVSLCISRKSDLPRWAVNRQKCCGLSFVRKISNQIIPFHNMHVFFFFLSILELLLLDYLLFSNFIILFLINEKDKTSLILNSSMSVNIIPSRLIFGDEQKWLPGRRRSRTFWPEINGPLFENKFVLCPQMDKACDVNLMYILMSLKYIRITLTVGKSWALLWIIRYKNL